jgi:hypothetical protein
MSGYAIALRFSSTTSFMLIVKTSHVVLPLSRREILELRDSKEIFLNRHARLYRDTLYEGIPSPSQSSRLSTQSA